MSRVAALPTLSIPAPHLAIPAAALILAAASLAYTFGNSGDGNESARNEALAISSSAASLEDPNETVASATGPASAPRAATGAGASDHETAPALMRLHENMAAARGQEIDRDQFLAELNRQHEAESIDAAWATQSEIEILTASVQPVMARADLKAQDIASDCRSSTCRVSARFAEVTDAETWGNLLVTQLGRTLSRARLAVVALPDGSAEARIYGTRKPG